MTRTRTAEPQWPLMHAVLAQGAHEPTQARLAEIAEVAPRTVTSVIKNLGALGIMVGGHPTRLGPGLGLIAGVSIGTERLAAGLIDANGTLHHEEIRTKVGQLDDPPHVLLGRVRDIVFDVVRRGLKDPSLRRQGPAASLPILGVAVAWPTPVDRDKRPVGRPLTDRAWRVGPRGGIAPSLPERTAAALGAPFRAEHCHALNDAAAHALAVAFDDARTNAALPPDPRWRVALTVLVGGGLGASTMLIAPRRPGRLAFIDSLLIEGTNGLAGELGHLPIGRRAVEELNEIAEAHELRDMKYDEWTCSCRKLHHLEAFVSGRALERRLADAEYEIPADGDERRRRLDAALSGGADGPQAHAMQDMGRLLGRAMAGPILMLDPSSITVTGSFASQYLVNGIERERNLWASTLRDSVSIAPYVDPYVGVKGAALAVIRQKVYRDYLDARAATTPPVLQITEAALRPSV